MACSGSDTGADEGKGEGGGAAPDPDPGLARMAAISREIRRRGADPAALIEVLHQVQLREGYLATGALHQVARELRLPLSRVFGVASFYHLFRLDPPPRRCLSLCHGTACFVNGAEQLEAILRARFAVGDAALPLPERSASMTAGPAAGSAVGYAVRQAAAVMAARSTARSTVRSAVQSTARSTGRTGDGEPAFTGGNPSLPVRMEARSVARSGDALPVCAGAAPSLPAAFAHRSGEDDGSEPADGGVAQGSGGWRLERSGCLGACGHDPVLRLEDGPVLRFPLRPAASLADRLAALGLPLLPPLPALVP